MLILIKLTAGGVVLEKSCGGTFDVCRWLLQGKEKIAEGHFVLISKYDSSYLNFSHI